VKTEAAMRYQVFGRHTGLRVSAFALGCGNFGTAWGYGAEPAEARRMFDRYLDAGGNFIDTADNYQAGESETLLGEFIGSRRDHLVLATKYTWGQDPAGGMLVTGNSRLNLRRSVEASLRRLRTDRIDLLWVHMPDGVTPIDEIVRGLDDLARAGKIVFAGLSDFPAWRVARAATLAELRGSLPVAAMQIEYSLVERTPERELLPMARAFGLGTVAWSPLGGGLLTGKYRRGESGRATQLGVLIHGEDDAQKTGILDALHAVAAELGSNPGRVALAWIVARGIVPILGPKSLAQLEDNLSAAEVRLDAGQSARLDAASAVAPGFPHEMLMRPDTVERLAGGPTDRFDPGLPAGVR
jgi:aryl-alcohol dehydrogenase-like predicted oxidoreductase